MAESGIKSYFPSQTVSDQEKLSYDYGLKVASAMTFAVITLFIMDSMLADKIQYSKSNINQEILSPTRNVANQMEKCDDAKDSIQASDSLKCE